jgi:hypothetical protein
MLAKTDQFWRAFHIEKMSDLEWVAEWNRITVTKIVIIKFKKEEK